MATKRATQKGNTADAPAVLKLASYWILERTSLRTIELMAQVKLNTDPDRAAAADWKQALSMARWGTRCIAEGDASGAAEYSLEAFRYANRAELLEGPAKLVARDAKRQAGTRKPRRPDIDEWLNAQLDKDSGAKAPGLWSVAPDWITDAIGEDAFKKRVTVARKLRRK